MTEFENQNKEQEAQSSSAPQASSETTAAPSTPQSPPEVATTQPTSQPSSEVATVAPSDVTVAFQNVWTYVLNFIKAPVSTLKSKELGSTEATILLVLLPIAYFTSVWSLIRGLIDAMIRLMDPFGLGGGWGMPSPAQLRSEALAEVRWGNTFFNGLITSLIWFALMMFVPLIVAGIFKNTQLVDTKKLFSKMAVITIPVTLLFFSATILGFMSLWLWLLPVAASLILPMILHFVIIRDLFNETPDKAIYITFVTQIVILVFLGFWLNSQMNNMFTGMMMGGLW